MHVGAEGGGSESTRRMSVKSVLTQCVFVLGSEKMPNSKALNQEVEAEAEAEAARPGKKAAGHGHHLPI